MDKAKNKPTQFELDAEFVRKIALLLKETGLHEIEYEEGDRRIRCVGAPPQATSHPVIMAPTAAPAPIASAPVAAAPEKATAAGTPVTSPMVGTAYLAPEPGAAPFVKAGDKVKQGDTLLIIEAMKVMNPIKAPKAGTVVEVMVADSTPVEFGEPLIVIG